MKELVRQAMRDGAVGVSTSLEYAPAPYAKTEELIALARGAHVAGNVDSDALLFEPGEIFAKRPPIGVNVIVIVLLLIGAENGIAERGDGFAFTCYLRGDALIDFRRQAGVDEDRVFRLTEHVDKTGSDHFAAGIDGASARRGAEIADRGNLAVANSDVA